MLTCPEDNTNPRHITGMRHRKHKQVAVDGGKPCIGETSEPCQKTCPGKLSDIMVGFAQLTLI